MAPPKKVAPPPPPEAVEPIEAPMEPGIADQILAALRNVEPFKSVLDKLLKNTQGADAALQGLAPPPPANLPAPPGLDPTVQALRNGTSASIPNQ